MMGNFLDHARWVRLFHLFPLFFMMSTTSRGAASASFPLLHENPGPSDAQETAFQRALCYGGRDTKFRTIYNLFSRESDTDLGPGAHYLFGLVGHAYSGARQTI